jgi:hypothetical protein
MFRDLLGSLRKEAEKRLTQQEEERKREEPKRQEQFKQQPQPRNRRSGKYGRLAAWIKSNYGNNFRDGQTSNEVKNQLEKIFGELDKRGSIGSDAKRGFRTYIDTRKYGDLIKVRE